MGWDGMGWEWDGNGDESAAFLFVGGRYWLPARLDLGLTHLLQSGKLFVGQKIRVSHEEEAHTQSGRIRVRCAGANGMLTGGGGFLSRVRRRAAAVGGAPIPHPPTPPAFVDWS